MISHETRTMVRQRAKFSCEYCDVSETEVGGELTVDHFKPQSKDGSDEPENLIYACSRCNLYKGDYFPENDSDQNLWNPRIESSEKHFILLTNGQMQALTKTGEFTIRRLRLNQKSSGRTSSSKTNSNRRNFADCTLSNFDRTFDAAVATTIRIA